MSQERTRADDLIHEMLARRGERAASGGLRDSILATVADAPQGREFMGRLRNVLGGTSTTRLLALAILLTGILGTTLAIAAGQRGPFSVDRAVVEASPSATARPTPFVAPTPDDLASPPPGSRLANRVGAPFSYVIPDDLVVDAGSLQIDDGEVFELQVLEGGTKGISVAEAGGAVVHPCPLVIGRSSRIPIRVDRVGLVEDLREVAGVALVDAGSTLIDGREADVYTIDVAAAACDATDLHIGSGAVDYIELDRPSHLMVTTVRDRTVVIALWASDPDVLAAWLEPGRQIIDSIRFR
jgi:hypothetical protein